ncbi:methyltransferase domain-containing protein [Rhizobium sp. BR 362]|uniref:methyltransferase domain-containing protein n=1 Tax=Rhizobium sp. BR 362 TaxID=3040670 RepID=UPI002F3E2D2C
MDYARRLQRLNTAGIGLEVAPYFNPTLRRSEFNVVYTDYISNEEIAAKAVENPSAAGREIPKIDFVWTPGVPLKECAPTNACYDYALASHVMEHVPNPIGWLNEILETLKVGAQLRLMLPDRRHTNDYLRPVTTFAQLISYWLERPAVPTSMQVCDFLSSCLDDRLHAGFDDEDRPINTVRAYTDAEAVNFAEFVYNERQYIDVHCTVWTPSSFEEAITRAAALGIINADIEIINEARVEFVVDLIKRGEPSRRPSPKRYSPTSEQSRVSSNLSRLASMLLGIRH